MCKTELSPTGIGLGKSGRFGIYMTKLKLDNEVGDAVLQ